MSSIEANRTAKALRLADVLRSHEASADEAATLPDETWVTIAELAGVRLPSGATRAMVVIILREQERWKTQDPFSAFS